MVCGNLTLKPQLQQLFILQCLSLCCFTITSTNHMNLHINTNTRKKKSLLNQISGEKLYTHKWPILPRLLAALMCTHRHIKTTKHRLVLDYSFQQCWMLHKKRLCYNHSVAVSINHLMVVL